MALRNLDFWPIKSPIRSKVEDQIDGEVGSVIQYLVERKIYRYNGFSLSSRLYQIIDQGIRYGEFEEDDQNEKT